MTAPRITGVMVEAAAEALYQGRRERWMEGEDGHDSGPWEALPELGKAAIRLDAGVALEAAERAAWVPAHEAPAAWEGTAVLLASDGAVERRHLSPGFSREPAHCRGLLVRPVPRPPGEDGRG